MSTNTCHFRDSETFEYTSDDGHDGLHRILKRTNEDIYGSGYYLTQLGRLTYVWESDENGVMRWVKWSEDHGNAYQHFSRLWLNRSVELVIQDDLFRLMGGGIDAQFGRTIQVIPRMVHELGRTNDLWVVDLNYGPARFRVIGELNVTWMHDNARLDEPLTINVKDGNFQ